MPNRNDRPEDTSRSTRHRREFFTATLILPGLLARGFAGEEQIPSRVRLVPLDTLQGRVMLRGCTEDRALVSLLCNFETQSTPTYCGVASSVMCLNASGVERPAGPAHLPGKIFSQETFFGANTSAVVSLRDVAREGMTLQQLRDVLATFPLTTRARYASDCSPQTFRDEARAALASDDGFVLVNYARRSLGQSGPGHISPIGAYNAEQDAFLILDVTRYQYAPVWVKFDDLWAAMNTPDSSSGKTRGYVVLRPATRVSNR